MTEANYRRTVRARHRAAAIDRIADRLADGVLSELPDLFLLALLAWFDLRLRLDQALRARP